MKKWPALIGAVVFFVMLWSVAFAHAELDHCTPAVGSVVASPPTQVVCVFDEEIDTKQSTMSVFDANNVQVDKKDAHVDLNDPDHKTLIVSLDTSKVQNGTFTVKWHTVTPDDNGITDGTFQFNVGSSQATPAPTTEVKSGGQAEPSPTAGAGGNEPVVTSTTTAEDGSGSTPIPNTGGSGNVSWMILAAVGIMLLLSGIGLRVRR